MKFLASKKLSDNATLRGVILWMLLLFILAMGLNLSTKAIEFGLTPHEWVATVMGNPDEFTDPMLFSDLLLGIHTDLFGLIITFILTASLYVRSSRKTVLKISMFTILLLSLLLYPLGVIGSSVFGNGGVITGLGSFIVFHLVIIGISIDLLVALLRKRL